MIGVLYDDRVRLVGRILYTDSRHVVYDNVIHSRLHWATKMMIHVGDTYRLMDNDNEMILTPGVGIDPPQYTGYCAISMAAEGGVVSLDNHGSTVILDFQGRAT